MKAFLSLQVLSQMIGYSARVADELKSGRVSNNILKSGIADVSRSIPLKDGARGLPEHGWEGQELRRI